mgnify:FL=1
MTIEESIGFTGNSHIEYPHNLFQTNSESEKIDISFSTTKDDGMLLWKSQKELVGNGDDLVLLQVKHGKVYLEYELGGGKFPFVILSMTRVLSLRTHSDDTWSKCYRQPSPQSNDL